MPTIGLVPRVFVATLLLLAGHLAAAHGEQITDQFYRAYFLEREQADFAGAAKLYTEVVSAKDAAAELQTSAKARLAVCREELAAADLARLMPPGPLAYVELNRPGDRLSSLLKQLGLLAGNGKPPAGGQNRLAISPVLIDTALGLRGAALAITGFDPSNQRPSGVLVVHPGDMEIVRGLIETGLPAAAEIMPSVGGFPTYQVEGVYITLTARLVLAASGPADIEAVLERMKDPKAESLATDAELAEILKDRHGELLFVCINPKPLMPMLSMLMAAGATQSREAALAQALLDPNSLRAVTARLDVDDQGLALELTLRLDEGHRNLVYNFLRRPAIDRETLRCVPAGAAALLTLSMNQAPAKYADTTQPSSNEPPVVTALDIGREIFANINGLTIYALPPAADGAEPGGIPDLAAAITVNDPAKSQALWSQLLGIASLATGASSMEGAVHEIADTPVRSYRFDKNVTVHQATSGHYLLLAATESALTRSLDAQRSGKSVIDDPGFASLLARLGPHTTVALLAHAGRCAAIARPFLSPSDAAKFEPVAELLTRTSAFVTVDHSDRLLRLSVAVAGVPDVSGLVSKLLTEERQRERSEQAVARAIGAKQWDKALAMLDSQLAEQPNSASVLQRKFDLLAVNKQDPAAALAVAESLSLALWDDATALNNFAWALLTEKQYGQRFNDLALRLSHRSNELTKQGNWAYVDTLAHAEFETGDVEKAIELEQKAIKLSKTKANGAGFADLEKALRRFQGAEEAEVAEAETEEEVAE
jgi:hypothetical protein